MVGSASTVIHQLLKGHYQKLLSDDEKNAKTKSGHRENPLWRVVAIRPFYV
jgi:hypothetical protein